MKPLTQYPKHKRKKLAKIRARHRRPIISLGYIGAMWKDLNDSCEDTIVKLNIISERLQNLQALQTNKQYDNKRNT